jgi:2-polyprenyl-3-methyl-5-hydroxy-6-metoxy-1,4-benzoquinol methylase
MEWNPTTHYKDVAVAERYDRERFSSVPGRIFNALEQRAIRAAFHGLPPSATIVDVPCGTGRLAETLLDNGFRVVGVDISQAMLHVAGRKLARFGARFESIVADVHELAQRAPQRYDAALCARVLMHFELSQQIAFLRSVATLARGRVVFSQSISTAYQRSRRRVKAWLGHRPSAMYPITEAELARLLDGAGLREVRRIRVASLLSEGMFVVAEHA